MNAIYFLLLLVSSSLISCASIANEDSVTDSNILAPTEDMHSFSNVDQIRTEHLHLELTVNFNNNTINGIARHEMSNHDVDTAIFDIKGLDIQKITLGKENEVTTNYVIGKEDKWLGQSLRVVINKNTKFINIYYRTTEKTEALDWLQPELTTGKKHPYMYTQGQAILTRSWIPLQDTPMNRITYSADVKVPSELLAVMSASNPVEKNKTGEYHFEMRQKIPSYLIALAVGDMYYTRFNDRCGVYSEPELAEASKYEFADLPKMIDAAEEMYGAYKWDQYDIVILPYSFPFGGMENPRLTFANPTILAGDRSLVTVIAHELAHSWSGNLVTNATWNDFWLNEGFTVYFENRIMEKIYGKETADILALIEYQDLEVAIKSIAKSDYPEDSKLKLELENRNPDDGMTDIAYIKGAFFLRTLEQAVGRQKFDAFLNHYFDAYSFKTITTEEFVAYLEKELLHPNGINFNTKEWIYEAGMPSNCIKIRSDRLDKMIELAERVNNDMDVFTGDFKNVDRNDYITQEWQTFIRSLDENITSDKMKMIDRQLRFSTEANPAIKSDWFLLSVKTGYKEIRPHIEAFLTKIGRRWYIESIYRAAKNSEDPENLEWGKSVYLKAKPNYHYISRSTIEEILYQ